MTQQFKGFAPPHSNYSRLPHEFIDALPFFTSEAEIKVVLYIIRHTWGFSDSECEPRLMTVDEIMNGRKRRDGSRMDRGTGLSKPSVIRGLRDAETHGFIDVVVDGEDKGRVKKRYSVRSFQPPEQGSAILTPEVNDSDPRGKESLPQGSGFFTPGVKNLYPRGQDSLPRTEKDNKDKETEERKKEKTTPFGVEGIFSFSEPDSAQTAGAGQLDGSGIESAGITPDSAAALSEKAPLHRESCDAVPDPEAAPSETIARFIPGDSPEAEAYINPPLTPYPVSSEEVNEFIAAWWEWVPVRPTYRGKETSAPRWFGAKVVREHASALIARGIAAADMVLMLAAIRHCDAAHPLAKYKKQGLTFENAARLLEEDVVARRRTAYYSADSPRVTARRPGVCIFAHWTKEECMANKDLIVDVPRPLLTAADVAGFERAQSGRENAERASEPAQPASKETIGVVSKSDLSRKDVLKELEDMGVPL